MIDDKTMQRALQRAGFYAAAIDGDVGPKTKAAARAAVSARVDPARVGAWSDERVLIAWQQCMFHDAGLDPGVIDGLVGPDTLFALEGWHARMRAIADPEPDPREVEPDPDDAAAVAAHAAALQRASLRWPRQSEVPAFYGAVGKNQTRLALPYPMKLAWDRDTIVTSISLHVKVAESAGRAFARIAEIYSPEEIARHGFDIFSGSLNVRKMRGGSAYSMHSWGIAIDFDNQRNDLHWGRDRAYLARPECAAFLDAWEAEGWVSLGRERNYDWMHVQAARL